MKKTLLNLIAATSMIVVAFSFTAKAQLAFSDIKYWIGTGSDTSILVVDFQDATWDTCYAWGYLHSSGATGEDMLNAIADADPNFSISFSSGFLNDIIYGSHAGLGGNPNYWSTWSGTSIASMNMNGGASTALSSGDWFGCSYTDFDPALAPGEAISAFNPFYFTAQDINFWVGTGTDTSLLVIDFLDGSAASSFAWGYLHSGTVTAEQMLNDIDAADPNLNVAISGGSLSDITYHSFSGIGGSPDYWGTWSATNLGNWDMNLGASTILGNGDLFGCSYISFGNVLRPGYPTAASAPAAIADYIQPAKLFVYPNPAVDIVNINLSALTDQYISLNVKDISGKLIHTQSINSFQIISLNVSNYTSGIYFITITSENTIINTKIIVNND